jgi:hypothetical protein
MTYNNKLARIFLIIIHEDVCLVRYKNYLTCYYNEKRNIFKSLLQLTYEQKRCSFKTDFKRDFISLPSDKIICEVNSIDLFRR